MTRLRDDLKPGGACLGLGAILLCWGGLAVIIVPIDRLLRRVRGG